MNMFIATVRSPLAAELRSAANYQSVSVATGEAPASPAGRDDSEHVAAGEKRFDRRYGVDGRGLLTEGDRRNRRRARVRSKT